MSSGERIDYVLVSDATTMMMDDSNLTPATGLEELLYTARSVPELRDAFESALVKQMGMRVERQVSWWCGYCGACGAVVCRRISVALCVCLHPSDMMVIPLICLVCVVGCASPCVQYSSDRLWCYTLIHAPMTTLFRQAEKRRMMMKLDRRQVEQLEDGKFTDFLKGDLSIKYDGNLDNDSWAGVLRSFTGGCFSGLERSKVFNANVSGSIADPDHAYTAVDGWERHHVAGEREGEQHQYVSYSLTCMRARAHTRTRCLLEDDVWIARRYLLLGSNLTNRIVHNTFHYCALCPPAPPAPGISCDDPLTNPTCTLVPPLPHPPFLSTTPVYHTQVRV
jgi:hypothetical protein